MAWPADYEGYTPITIPAAQVAGGPHTESIKLITEAAFADRDAANNPLDTSAGRSVQAGGGDIVVSDDSNTRLPIQVFYATPGAGGGTLKLYVRIPSLPAAGMTLRFWYKSSQTESQPAVGDPFGRYDTNQDYARVYEMNELAGNFMDSCGNDTVGATQQGTLTRGVSAPPAGLGAEFPGGNNNNASSVNAADLEDWDEGTVEVCLNGSTANSPAWTGILGLGQTVGVGSQFFLGRWSGGNNLNLNGNDAELQNTSALGWSGIFDGNDNNIVFQFGPHADTNKPFKVFKNGVVELNNNGNSRTRPALATAQLSIGCEPENLQQSIDSVVGYFRIRNDYKSEDFYTTQYNNEGDVGAFWQAADYVEAGPGSVGTAAGQATTNVIGCAKTRGLADASASATVTGVGNAAFNGLAQSSGQAAVNGVGDFMSAPNEMVGTATGSATANAVSQAKKRAQGAAAGSAISVGVALVEGMGTGISLASATVNGAGLSEFRADWFAEGKAFINGVGDFQVAPGEGTGEADGQATVNGFARATASAMFSATAGATVSGFAGGEAISSPWDQQVSQHQIPGSFGELMTKLLTRGQYFAGKDQ